MANSVEPGRAIGRRTGMGRTKRWLVGAVGIGLAVGLIGACGDGRDDASSKASLASADSAGGGSAALKAELAKGPVAGTQIEDRKVVYHGTLTVRVANAEKAADEAVGFAADVNGYLGKQDSQLEGDREVDVTLRIPADDFDDVMAKVAKLGTVQARKVDSDDVTDQVVDLEGRLENAKASSARLRELLGKAQNVDNIAALEDRLTQRESEIEQISGQLEVIQDEVQFATVRATFTEKDEPKVSDDLPGPLDSLRAGLVAFVTVALGLLAALAFALPFLLVALVVWLGYRRWRRSHPTAARPVPPPWPTTATAPLPPPPDPVPAGAAAPPAAGPAAESTTEPDPPADD